MTKRIILSTALGFIFMAGVQAQEKKKKRTYGAEITPVEQKTEPKKKLQNPDANVNFEEVQDTRTLGQDVVNVKTLKLDGMVVGDKQSSNELNIDKTRKVQIEFKSDNPNALYYLVDRLDNVIIPAREGAFNDELKAGHYFLKVGLIQEAAKMKEKATFSFIIK